MASQKTRLIPLIIADVYQLAGEFRVCGEAIAKTAGQTQARWQVLSAASAEPKTVPHIARRLGVTRQGVQRLANLLERDGLATFVPNPHHKASPYLVLTPNGRAALTPLTEAAGQYHRVIATSFTDAELPALHAGLRRLLVALKQFNAED